MGHGLLTVYEDAVEHVTQAAGNSLLAKQLWALSRFVSRDNRAASSVKALKHGSVQTVGKLFSYLASPGHIR
jgi:hypothetical protein